MLSLENPHWPEQSSMHPTLILYDPKLIKIKQEEEKKSTTLKTYDD